MYAERRPLTVAPLNPDCFRSEVLGVAATVKLGHGDQDIPPPQTVAIGVRICSAWSSQRIASSVLPA